MRSSGPRETMDLKFLPMWLKKNRRGAQINWRGRWTVIAIWIAFTTFLMEIWIWFYLDSFHWVPLGRLYDAWLLLAWEQKEWQKDWKLLRSLCLQKLSHVKQSSSFQLWPLLKYPGFPQHLILLLPPSIPTYWHHISFNKFDFIK